MPSAEHCRRAPQSRPLAGSRNGLARHQNERPVRQLPIRIRRTQRMEQPLPANQERRLDRQDEVQEKAGWKITAETARQSRSDWRTVIVLLDTSHDLDTCAAELGCEVGTLLTPLTRYTLREPNRPWAIDNGAFSRFEEASFWSLLSREQARRDECLFVTAPQWRLSSQQHKTWGIR